MLTTTIDEPQHAASPPTGPKLHLVIEPQRGWRGIGCAELWRYRELLFFLAWRDVKVRYKQTALGAMWAVIQPVMTMIVFVVFFGRLGGLDRDVQAPYPIFVYAGILPWTFFAASVGQAANSLLGNSNLITKIYFPRLIVPISTIAAALVDFAISMGVMVVMMVWYESVPSVWIVLLPVLIVGLIAAAIGMGAFLAALVVEYRDFRYVVPFLIQMWMFASPVAYSIEKVPEAWRLVYALNPLAGLIHGFRAALLSETLEPACVAVSLAMSLVFCIVGLLYFARVERRLSDIV